MALRRFQDWPARLEEFLQGALGRPFSWRQWNCVLFTAAAVEAMTGFNPADGFGAESESEEDAGKKLSGYGGLESAVTSVLGTPLSTVNKAQRGDIVLGGDESGGMLGVIDLSGKNFVAVTARDGLRVFPRRAAVVAWRV